jgi:hypothetical protein
MNAVSSLNGSVYSQGVKVDHRAWLDMGSKEWMDTSDELKAAAYQAAKVCGWTDDGLKNIIVSSFSPRIDHFTADVIIETLQELANKHPIPVEEVYEVKEDKPIFKSYTPKDVFKM